MFQYPCYLLGYACAGQHLIFERSRPLIHTNLERWTADVYGFEEGAVSCDMSYAFPSVRSLTVVAYSGNAMPTDQQRVMLLFFCARKLVGTSGSRKQQHSAISITAVSSVVTAFTVALSCRAASGRSWPQGFSKHLLIADGSSSSPTQVRCQDPQFRQQYCAATRKTWRFFRSGGSFTLEGLYDSSCDSFTPKV